MKATSTEARALQAAQEAYRLTGYKSELLTNEWSHIETLGVTDRSAGGTIGIPIGGAESRLVVTYALTATAGSREFVQGRCELSFEPQRPGEWDFMFDWLDGAITMYPSSDVGRYRLRARAVVAVLEALTEKPEAIGAELRELRYPPTLAGINSAISEMLGEEFRLVRSGQGWQLHCSARCMRTVELGRPAPMVPTGIVQFLDAVEPG
jgi:hypothetical protein